jgi:hypothetical protein
MSMCMYYSRLTKFSVMTLDDGMLYLISAASIMQLLEVGLLLEEIHLWKNKRKKGDKWWKYEVNYSPLNSSGPFHSSQILL